MKKIKLISLLIVISMFLTGCGNEPVNNNLNEENEKAENNMVCNFAKNTLTEEEPNEYCDYEIIYLTWEWQLRVDNTMTWAFVDNGLVDTPSEYVQFIPDRDGSYFDGTDGERVTKTIYKIK